MRKWAKNVNLPKVVRLRGASRLESTLSDFKPLGLFSHTPGSISQMYSAPQEPGSFTDMRQEEQDAHRDLVSTLYSYRGSLLFVLAFLFYVVYSLLYIHVNTTTIIFKIFLEFFMAVMPNCGMLLLLLTETRSYFYL